MCGGIATGRLPYAFPCGSYLVFRSCLCGHGNQRIFAKSGMDIFSYTRKPFFHAGIRKYGAAYRFSYTVSWTVCNREVIAGYSIYCDSRLLGLWSECAFYGIYLLYVGIEILPGLACFMYCGSIAIIELTAKHDDPLFAEIKNLSRPKTDGERIYWSNGASLTVEDIIN